MISRGAKLKNLGSAMPKNRRFKRVQYCCIYKIKYECTKWKKALKVFWDIKEFPIRSKGSNISYCAIRNYGISAGVKRKKLNKKLDR